MKKDRNCGMNNYPIYPAYPIQNMMPGIPMMPNMTPNYYAGNNTTNSIEQQINTLNNQINSLERRLTNLENIIGGNNKYNTSNYQML